MVGGDRLAVKLCCRSECGLGYYDVVNLIQSISPIGAASLMNAVSLDVAMCSVDTVNSEGDRLKGELERRRRMMGALVNENEPMTTRWQERK